MNDSGFRVKTELEISDQRVKDLLCCAFEGGSNYWYQIVEFVNPENLKVEFRHLDLPLISGCALIVSDAEESVRSQLDRSAIQFGLNLMSTRYPQHFASFLEENEDAETGDVFLQCCLFGELVYG